MNRRNNPIVEFMKERWNKELRYNANDIQNIIRIITKIIFSYKIHKISKIEKEFNNKIEQ